jgi:hypothetical protein
MHPAVSPRIFFRGVVEANVPTGNNQFPPPLVDIPGAGLNPAIQNDDAAVRRTLMNADGSGGYGQGGWNYFGDNGFTFVDTRVTGVQWADGLVVHDPARDSLIGRDVELCGHTSPTASRRTAPVTVDVDPQSDWASFVVADLLRIGTPAATCFEAHGLSMGTMRWVSMARNTYMSDEGAEGALMQFVCRGGVKLPPIGGNPSRAIDELGSALATADGVSVLLALYNFNLNLKSAKTLQAAFARGEYLTNAAMGFMVGVVQTWHEGEPLQIPAGRYLGPTAEGTVPVATSPGRNGSPSQATVPLGPVLVQQAPRLDFLTVNLMNTVPESNPKGDKIDPGPLYLEWVPDREGPAVRLHAAPLPTDRAAYEATSGLVDVKPLEKHTWTEGRFQLVRDSRDAVTPPTVVHQELERVISTDGWATYLDHGERRAIDVRAWRRGVPDAHSTFQIRQYRIVPTGLPTTEDLEMAACLVGSADPTLEPVVTHQAEVRTNGAGAVRLELQGSIPGTCLLRFWTDADGPPFRWIPGAMDMYANLRVLPLDEEIAALPPTWSNAYNSVLRYYFLTYPAMSKYIPLNREESVRTAAGAILARLDADGWDRTTFMPVTREMSRGKRELLARWCRSVLRTLGTEG